jgi:Lrp/AsnC family transcriptional regulator for asnA, asnC and gidA
VFYFKRGFKIKNLKTKFIPFLPMEDKELPLIEEVDLDILKILSDDSKTKYHHIANKLGKSPITIKTHIDKLEGTGIIKNYGVQIDYEKLGYNIIAVIEITISKGKMLEIEKEIAENPNVFGVYDITGDYDALILARFKNRFDLSAMIKKMHESPYIERTNTHLILNVIKEDSSFNNLLLKEKLKK